MSVEHIARLTRLFYRSLHWSVVLDTQTLKLALIETVMFLSFSYWLGPKTRNIMLALCNPKHMRQHLLAWKQDSAVAVQMLLSLKSIVLGLASVSDWVSSHTRSLEHVLLRAVGWLTCFLIMQVLLLLARGQSEVKLQEYHIPYLYISHFQEFKDTFFDTSFSTLGQNSAFEKAPCPSFFALYIMKTCQVDTISAQGSRTVAYK